MGGDGGSGRVGAGRACEGVALSGPWVVVLRGVGDDEHVGVGATALDLLSGRAALGAAAPVISPEEKRKEGRS